MNKIRTALLSATAVTLTAFIPLAFAATPGTLFGGATESTGKTTLVSDLSNASPDDNFSGIDFSVPSGMTFADLTELSTDYNVTDDDCAGGSPRFQVNVDTGSGVKNIFVYIGPHPSFTGCPTGDQSTGDLLESADARFDLTQLGGPFYGTYADALALAGTYEITGVQLVVDSGWAFADSEQTIVVANSIVGFGAPTTKDQCKNGGWQAFTDPAFKNQGDCVSSIASQGKAKGNPTPQAL